MIDSNILYGGATLILALLAYVAGQKHTSIEEAQAQGEFKGEIKTKLDSIFGEIKELKKSLELSTTQLSKEIDEQIKKHEEIYHNVKQ